MTKDQNHAEVIFFSLSSCKNDKSSCPFRQNQPGYIPNIFPQRKGCQIQIILPDFRTGTVSASITSFGTFQSQSLEPVSYTALSGTKATVRTSDTELFLIRSSPIVAGYKSLHARSEEMRISVTPSLALSLGIAVMQSFCPENFSTYPPPLS